MNRTMSATLRAVADLLDAHPDLPLPYVTTSSNGTATAAWYLTIWANAANEAEQKAKAVAIMRAFGGKWDKDFGDNDAYFRQHIGDVELVVQTAREAVCERVVVGAETVTLPAVAAQPERTEVREVIEWRCEPVMAEVAS